MSRLVVHMMNKEKVTLDYSERGKAQMDRDLQTFWKAATEGQAVIIPDRVMLVTGNIAWIEVQ